MIRATELIRSPHQLEELFRLRNVNVVCPNLLDKLHDEVLNRLRGEREYVKEKVEKRRRHLATDILVNSRSFFPRDTEKVEQN